MDTWHKKRMLLGEAEEKWRGEAGGVPPAPSPRGADHQKCSCPDLHTSTLPPPRGSPLFSPWKPADSPAGKEAKAGLTVAGGQELLVGVAVFWGVFRHLSKQPCRVPEWRRAKAVRVIHPWDSCAKPRSIGRGSVQSTADEKATSPNTVPSSQSWCLSA